MATGAQFGCLLALGLMGTVGSLGRAATGMTDKDSLIVYVFVGLVPLIGAVRAYHRAARERFMRLQRIVVRRRIVRRLREGPPLAAPVLLASLSLDETALRDELHALWMERFFAGAVCWGDGRIAPFPDPVVGTSCPFCGAGLATTFLVVQECSTCAAELFPSDAALRVDDYPDATEPAGTIVIWSLIVLGPAISMIGLASEGVTRFGYHPHTLRHVLLWVGVPSLALLWRVHLNERFVPALPPTRSRWRSRIAVFVRERGRRWLGMAILVIALLFAAGAIAGVLMTRSLSAFLAATAVSAPLAALGMYLYYEGVFARYRMPTSLRQTRRHLLFTLRASEILPRSAVVEGLSIPEEDLPDHLEALHEDALISAWIDGTNGKVRKFDLGAPLPTDCPTCSAPLPKMGDSPPRDCEACGSRLYHHRNCSLTDRYPTSSPVVASFALQGCCVSPLLAVLALSDRKGVDGSTGSGPSGSLLLVPVIYLVTAYLLGRLEERLISVRAGAVAERESVDEVLADIGSPRSGISYDLQPIWNRTGLVDPRDRREVVVRWLAASGVAGYTNRLENTLCVVSDEAGVLCPWCRSREFEDRTDSLVCTNCEAVEYHPSTHA